MKPWQKAVKYLAMVFAVFLCVNILGGILSIAGIFINDDEDNPGDMKEYSVNETVNKLEIDISAADFKIVCGSGFSIKSNIDKLKIYEKDGYLKISEKWHGWLANIRNNSNIILTVPYGTVFDDADIETGAGSEDIDALSADKLKLSLGAGKVHINELNAFYEAEIDGGVGELVIKNGNLNNLELDMGVGQLNFTGGIKGNSSVDNGIGSSYFTLAGSKDDYRIHIDKGIGSARIDGEKMKDGDVYGQGNNRIDIDGGIGKINIEFEYQ